MKPNTKGILIVMGIACGYGVVLAVFDRNLHGLWAGPVVGLAVSGLLLALGRRRV